MSTDQDLLTEAAGRLLDQECSLETVRAIEGGDGERASRLWGQIADAGFDYALVPEAAGGAGLGLKQVMGMLERCGASLLPLPLADTLVSRAMLVGAGQAMPTGAISLAQGRLLADGAVQAVLHGGRFAQNALVQVGDAWYLLPLSAEHCRPYAHALDCEATWEAAQRHDAHKVNISLPTERGPQILKAPLLAAQMAGAMARVQQDVLEYANLRQQFGRPIGKFQAIQHQLAVMGQHVFAARMAAQLGCVSDGYCPSPMQAAIAKARCSEAACEVVEIAHAVYGAIGVTAAFDLQLFTRRLLAWRVSAGSESYWHKVAGEALLLHRGLTLDLLRTVPVAA